MSEFKQYINGVKSTLLAYEQQEDYFMESIRNSLAISNVYSELWERAIQVEDEGKRKELMMIVSNVKRAKQVYDLMLNRYQYANTECSRQIAYNKALIEYVEKLENEIELSKQEL